MASEFRDRDPHHEDGEPPAHDPLRVVWRSPADQPNQAQAPDAAAGSATLDEQSKLAERLFEFLDGRTVQVRGSEWRIEVFSVLQHSNANWLQLGLNGDPSYTLTLRLADGEGVTHAMHILATWLASPGQTSHILNVA